MVEIIRFFGNPAIIGNLIALITAIILGGTGWAIFSQFQVAQRSQFNDQLGRGAELLAHAELTARVSGVRVLEDLAKSVKPDSDENKLVANILLDFVRERAAPPMKEDGTPYADENAPRHTLWDGMPYESSVAWPEPKPPEARLDIETAVLALGNIVPEDMAARSKYLNFSRLDLRGLDLPGAKLQHAYIFHAKLQGANLKEANLQHANLDQTDLQHAVLSGANLQHAALTYATLQGAYLSSANLQNTNLLATMTNANLWFADLRGARLLDASFENASLWHADFRGADLENVNFQGANLENVNFQGADLKNPNFERASLANANLQGVNLVNANFENLSLVGAQLQHADLRDAKFWFANLSDTNFQGVKNISTQQLAKIIYDKDKPPQNLPDGVALPSERAYELRDSGLMQEPYFVEIKKFVNQVLIVEAWEKKQAEETKPKK
ncbi:MAG: pentapeptide repeat-containing protein [Parvibaculales bacterium]